MPISNRIRLTFPHGCRAARVALLLAAVPTIPAFAATATITQASTSGATAGIASSPIGATTRARSMTRSVATPHMAMSISISHVTSKTAGGPGGVLVGHAMSRARSMAIDTPGRDAAMATVSSSARAGGAPNAQGSVSVGAGGAAQAASPGATATAQDSATAAVGGASAPSAAAGPAAVAHGSAAAAHHTSAHEAASGTGGMSAGKGQGRR